MHQPHIAIIVLHYKNLSDTRACLKSLGKIDYPKYSVVLVNNDAPEHGEALKGEFPDVALIQNDRNLGFAEGNNVGIRHALANDRTDAVLILNNDTVVEPNFLSEMAKQLPPPVSRRGSGGGDMIAPRMMQHDDRNKVDNLGIVIMKSGLAFNRLNEKQKLFCPSAGCALYTRKLLERIAHEKQFPLPTGKGKGEGQQDYFDPQYFAYCEDLDLGFRARRAGFEPAYARGAIIYHKGSASTAKLSDFAVYHTYRNLVWTLYKNYPMALFTRNLFWIILGWKLIFLGYLFKGRPLVIIRAILGGLRGIKTMKQKRAEIQKTPQTDNRAMCSWFEPGLFPKNLL